MNKKGFNLFTALISIILIVLTMLLVNAMIQSEATANNIISEAQEQARLESAAQAAKNEAAQLFNYYVRDRIETYLTAPGNEFTIQNIDTWNDFDSMVNEFAERNFAGEDNSSFAYHIALNICYLYDQLKITDPRYSVSVPNCGSYQGNITNTINAAIEKAVDDKKFFQVIDCDGTPGNCSKGTFYVTIPLKEISDEDYEKLPKIIFTDNFTGRTIKDIILPRQDLKLYIPIRLFKALTWARAFAHSANVLTSGINSASDYGVLSPRIHNEFEMYGLGLCDKGTCAPRTNPVKIPKSTAWTEEGKKCPNPNEHVYSGDSNMNITFDGSYGENSQDYQKNFTDIELAQSYTINTALTEMAKSRICFISNKLKDKLIEKLNGEEESFDFLEGNIEDLSCAFSEMKVEAGAVESKEILGINESHKEGEPITQNPFPNYPFFNGSCPYIQGRDYLEAHLLGAYNSENGIDFATTTREKCNALSDSQNFAYCSTISSINYTIALRETDPEYMVNENLYSDQKRAFRIKIVDNEFSGFNPNKKSSPEGIAGNCAFNGGATNNTCEAKDWQCVTATEGVAGTPIGCYPVGENN